MSLTFEALRSASEKLNIESDSLTPLIQRLNEVFKKLNLGISFWHVWINTTEGGIAIGYSRVDKRWGLAIKQFRNPTSISAYEDEVWLMQDAPRWMRIQAVAAIPALIETGRQRAEEVAKEVAKAQKSLVQIIEDLKA